MENQRVAWAAGFFDGEGCVSIWRKTINGKMYYSMKLDMYQVDRTPLDIFELLFGGTIKSRPRPPSQKTNSRDGWVWSQSSHEAAETLKTLLPHLVCKRAQAEIAIEFQRLKGRTGPHPYADPVAHFEKERQQFEEVKRLKVVT